MGANVCGYQASSDACRKWEELLFTKVRFFIEVLIHLEPGEVRDGDCPQASVWSPGS